MQAWFEGQGNCDRIAKGNTLVHHNYCPDRSREWQLLRAKSKKYHSWDPKAIHEQDFLRVTSSQGSNAWNQSALCDLGMLVMLAWPGTPCLRY